MKSSSRPAAPNYRISPAAHDLVLTQRRNDLGSELSLILAHSRSFVWEVGCGHGHFLAAYAAAHPGDVCIGIDIASDRIARGMRKRERGRLHNLHFIRAEARLFLEVIPEGRTIQDAYILFPDPWPKTRHHKHRILQTDFVEQLAERMGEGGRLFFRTDYQPYFSSALDVIRASARWEILADTWKFEHETVFQARADTFWSLAARCTPQRQTQASR